MVEMRQFILDRNCLPKLGIASVPTVIGVVGWNKALELSLDAYLMLSTTPPSVDCYIATAAAKGHSAFVGSEQIMLADGNELLVNSQLRLGKLFGSFTL